MDRPRSLTLPGGYRVQVKLLSDDAFALKCGRAAWAFWDDSETTNGGVIYLRRSRPIHEMWDDFGHELDHAVNDYRNWLDGTLIRPARDRERAELAALALEDE